MPPLLFEFRHVLRCKQLQRESQRVFTWCVYAVLCLLQLSQVDCKLLCVPFFTGCKDVDQHTSRGVYPLLFLLLILYAQLANMCKLPASSMPNGSQSWPVCTEVNVKMRVLSQVTLSRQPSWC